MLSSLTAVTLGVLFTHSFQPILRLAHMGRGGGILSRSLGRKATPPSWWRASGDQKLRVLEGEF